MGVMGAQAVVEAAAVNVQSNFVPSGTDCEGAGLVSELEPCPEPPPPPPPPPPHPPQHNSNRPWHHQLPNLLNHKNYMKPCNTAGDCPADEGLTCDDYQGRCTCSPPSRYDAFSRQCIEERPCSEETNVCLEENSVCLQGRCQCKLGFRHDRNTDGCIPVNTGPGRPVFSSFLAQNIFTLVIICNFLLWLSVFVFILQYIKRKRLAAAVMVHAANHNGNSGRGAGGGGGRAALPPGMPPPPPAYDNIAFDHGGPTTGLHFPPPPPYSLEDTDKVGTSEHESQTPQQPPTTVSVITVPSEPTLPRRLSSSGNVPPAV